MKPILYCVFSSFKEEIAWALGKCSKGYPGSHIVYLTYCHLEAFEKY